jgi:putative membrane protein
LKHGDSSFLNKAAKGGMEEVALGKVAAERATNPQVREFAQMMVTDHSSANSELMSLASTKGVTLSADSPRVEKWQKRSTDDFDMEDISKMVKDHEDDVEMFRKEAKKADDADVRAFASKTLPTLEAHYAKAKDIKAMLK